MKILTLHPLIVSIACAAGSNYDFKQNGADWPDDFPECGYSNQSPIDLSTSWDVVSAKKDNFNKLYTNQETGIQVNWVGDTSKISINKEGQDLQTFHSKFAQDYYGAGPRFNGVQFHFHAGSEHTIDGVRHDLEMHTVHLADDPQNGFNFAAMGIMFSTDKYNVKLDYEQQKIIDDFFDSLEWDNTYSNPKVAKVPYGDLMMMVDTDNRWVYSGSVTTPPCAKSVYWNVLTTIYPIKESVLKKFRGQLARTEGLENTGNWREIQKLDYHDPKILMRMDGKKQRYDDEDSEDEDEGRKYSGATKTSAVSLAMAALAVSASLI